MSEGAFPSATDDAEAFVAKWHGAWPERRLVEGFVPAAERDTAAAWQALQFELQEAAWGGADARPGEAKLAWWSDELAGWSQGRRRHPLGAVLQRRAAPWGELAHAVPALAATRRRPGTADDAWASLDAVAGAVAAIESTLFAVDSSRGAVAAAWLHARLARHPNDAVPVDQRDAGAWSRTLLQRWPSTRGLPVSRRIELALARARLARGEASLPRGPLAALWAGWRAARD